MKGIIESSQIPADEKVYLKKDFMGWRVVEPVIDPETKNILWGNVFSARGMITLAIILFILGVGYFAFEEQVTNYKSLTQNPCLYCKDCNSFDRGYKINLTILEVNEQSTDNIFTLPSNTFESLPS